VPWWLWLVGGVALLATLVGLGLWGAGLPARLRRLFREQRGRLQDEFFAAASASGKPRGLRWLALDWTVQGVEPEPLLARERGGGPFVALLPITIRFEAIPGSDMEGLPAVGNLRVATAVFFWHRGRWQTSGRALFNLQPTEALQHFRDQYTPLERVA
jgi:hypothetical protein